MKTKLLLTLALLAAASSADARNFTMTPSSSSRVRLEGTSNVHPFSSESSSFTAVLTLDADAQTPAAAASAIAAGRPAALTVSIPVASLKSERSGLDKNLRNAMSANKHPDVVYALESYEAAGTALTVKGTLTIAGVARPEVLKATATFSGGLLIVDGEQAFLMTDYGIKPPTMMLGAIRTGDRIVVKYHLELTPSK